MRRLVRGPWKWAVPKDFKQLSRGFYFPAEFRDLETSAKAAKLRVAVYEAGRYGGLRAEKRWASLHKITTDSVVPWLTQLRTCWGKWLQNPMCRTLTDVRETLRRQTPNNISCTGTQNELAKNEPRPWGKALTKHVKKAFQAAVTLKIRGKADGWHYKMERSLSKWQLPTYARTQTDRAFRLLKRISGMVPPRVVAALLRAWWDGWTTSARMHEPSGVACCPWCHMAEGDRVQHFGRCMELQKWRSSKLRLPWMHEVGDRNAQFFVLEALDEDANASVIVRCLALASCYHAYNAIKHCSKRLDETEAIRAISQSLRELTHDDNKLCRLVDNIWANRQGGHKSPSTLTEVEFEFTLPSTACAWAAVFGVGAHTFELVSGVPPSRHPAAGGVPTGSVAHTLEWGFYPA